MKADIWFPFYSGDYLRGTVGFTRCEHGAYLLAIIKYWDKGEALTPQELKAACGSELDVVSGCFVMEGGRWHHKRIDIELSKAAERLLKYREKANKMVAARRRLGQIPKQPETNGKP